MLATPAQQALQWSGAITHITRSAPGIVMRHIIRRKGFQPISLPPDLPRLITGSTDSKLFFNRFWMNKLWTTFLSPLKQCIGHDVH